MTLEPAIVTDEFMTDLDGMDTFIDDEFKSQEGQDFWEESYQELPDSREMDKVVDHENTKKAVDTYDQFVGDEVCL